MIRSLLCSSLLVTSTSATLFADDVLKQMPTVFERAGSQTKLMLDNVKDDPKFPRTLSPDGKVKTVKAEDWTSGFFPGTLWLLHEYDPTGGWKESAWEYTRRLEVIRHFKGNHDGGFMLGCSYGNALRLDPSDESRAVLRDASAALATRYIPKLGMIRSWDHGPFQCPVIIDNMMNLELLSWAAQNGGDAKLREIVLSHSDLTLKNHFRPDGSAYHVVDYDPATGRLRAIHATHGMGAGAGMGALRIHHDAPRNRQSAILGMRGEGGGVHYQASESSRRWRADVGLRQRAGLERTARCLGRSDHGVGLYRALDSCGKRQAILGHGDPPVACVILS